MANLNLDEYTGLGYEWAWHKVNPQAYMTYLESMKRLITIQKDTDWIEARERMLAGNATREDFIKYGWKKGVDLSADNH